MAWGGRQLGRQRPARRGVRASGRGDGLAGQARAAQSRPGRALDGDRLVGFVNVARDGGVHAFVLDTVVARDRRSGGVGSALVGAAADGARAAGCGWLHVDFEDHVRPFHLDACGFRETAAGLIAL